MKICINHNWSRAWRDPATRIDYQKCLVCGESKVSPIQFGQSEYVKPAPAPRLPRRAMRLVLGWMGVGVGAGGAQW